MKISFGSQEIYRDTEYTLNAEIDNYMHIT